MLQFISDRNLKAKVGTQGDIGNAWYVLLLTAKMNEFPFFTGKAERIANANATAGCIGDVASKPQNKRTCKGLAKAGNARNYETYCTIE